MAAATGLVETATKPSSIPSFTSISDLSSTLFHSTVNLQIPDEFLLPESSRPTVPYDAASQLPAINLAGAQDPNSTERVNVGGNVTEILQKWGFLQVLNHGVPKDLLQDIVCIGRHFFALSTEEKQRGTIGFLNGYTAKQINFVIGTPWVESLTIKVLPNSSVEPVEARMWPDGNPKFRESIYKFAEEMEKLEGSILQLLAEGLGLETTFFSRHFESKRIISGTHFNYYPPCPDPSKVLGMLPHTDPTCLTVLYQDGVSGLQIQADDGSWHAVDHNPDGLLVFVGDILQGWSNGRFPAVVHRVVLNQKIPRLSFVHGINPPADQVLEAPAELIDDNNCGRYKSFTYSKYMDFKKHHSVQLHGHTKPMDMYMRGW